MKRWIAWLLVPMLALSFLPGAAALAEEGVTDTAEIQESVVTREGERKEETLNDNLRLILNTFHSEEFQDLLKNPEVQDVLTEGGTAVGRWLLENRTVTMKILTELGVSERDRTVIDEIWDSADRLYTLELAYEQSEDGAQLAQELVTLKNNPAFIRFCQDYAKMLESEDLKAVLEGIQRTANEGSATENRELMDRFAEEGIDRDSPLGNLILSVLSFSELNKEANESLALLMKERDFWIVVVHIANNRANLEELPILEETRRLLNNPDVMAFLTETGQSFMKIVNILAEDRKEQQNAEQAEQTGGTAETNDGKEAE